MQSTTLFLAIDRVLIAKEKRRKKREGRLLKYLNEIISRTLVIAVRDQSKPSGVLPSRDEVSWSIWKSQK